MGGRGAVLEQEESIGGMLKVVEKVKADDSHVGKARFYEYNGNESPW